MGSGPDSGDAADMRRLADWCRQVADTARITMTAATPERSVLLGDVEASAQSLRVALLVAAHHADPPEENGT